MTTTEAALGPNGAGRERGDTVPSWILAALVAAALALTHVVGILVATRARPGPWIATHLLEVGFGVVLAMVCLWIGGTLVTMLTFGTVRLGRVGSVIWLLAGNALVPLTALLARQLAPALMFGVVAGVGLGALLLSATAPGPRRRWTMLAWTAPTSVGVVAAAMLVVSSPWWTVPLVVGGALVQYTVHRVGGVSRPRLAWAIHAGWHALVIVAAAVFASTVLLPTVTAGTLPVPA